MRKDHRHIPMSDWDFRFVSYDVPDRGVRGFDYKASDLEGKLDIAACCEMVKDWLTMSAQKLGSCKEH